MSSTLSDPHSIIRQQHGKLSQSAGVQPAIEVSFFSWHKRGLDRWLNCEIQRCAFGAPCALPCCAPPPQPRRFLGPGTIVGAKPFASKSRGTLGLRCCPARRLGAGLCWRGRRPWSKVLRPGGPGGGGWQGLPHSESKPWMTASSPPDWSSSCHSSTGRGREIQKHALCARLPCPAPAQPLRRWPCNADVCRGFSSPGNSGISEEMKEVGAPDVVQRNQEGVWRGVQATAELGCW